MVRETQEGVGKDLEIHGLFGLGGVERDVLAGTPVKMRSPASLSSFASLVDQVFTPISDF